MDEKTPKPKAGDLGTQETLAAPEGKNLGQQETLGAPTEALPPTKTGDLRTRDPARSARAYSDVSLPVVSREAYAVEGEFARGGLGRILKAQDQRMGRPVALKELLLSQRGTATARFFREALVTARLQHPGIVPVYETGRWPSGEPFYAI